MARPSKKTVYERIEDQKNKIKETEELLVTLNEELQTLFTERDELEMRQLFEMMRSKGLTIDEALSKIGEDTSQIEDEKPSKPKNKKADKEVIEITEE